VAAQAAQQRVARSQAFAHFCRNVGWGLSDQGIEHLLRLVGLEQGFVLKEQRLGGRGVLGLDEGNHRLYDWQLLGGLLRGLVDLAEALQPGPQVLDCVAVAGLLGLRDQRLYCFDEGLFHLRRHGPPEVHHLFRIFDCDKRLDQRGHGGAGQGFRVGRGEGLQVGRQGGVALQGGRQTNVVGHAGRDQAVLQTIRQRTWGWCVVGHGVAPGYRSRKQWSLWPVALTADRLCLMFIVNDR